MGSAFSCCCEGKRSSSLRVQVSSSNPRASAPAMTMAPVAPIEERLAGMAAAIRQLIPAAEVRLFGSLVQEAFSHGVLLDGQL
jgi:hypothetical protein